MIEVLRDYFLFFMMYSFIGWLIEIVDFIIEKHKLVDRGFLIGPYLPIYGFGALFIVIFLSGYREEPITLFCMSMILCATLEYLTSLIMEKIFHARWWDYGDKKFNINGRICLETASLFGIAGCIGIYVLQPFFTKIISLINPVVLNVIAIVLFIIFVVDVLVSFKIIFKFRTFTKNVKKDSTSEISRMVKNTLFSNSILNKRLISAFPNVQATIKDLKKKRFWFKRKK